MNNDNKNINNLGHNFQKRMISSERFQFFEWGWHGKRKMEGRGSDYWKVGLNLKNILFTF